MKDKRTPRPRKYLIDLKVTERRESLGLDKKSLAIRANIPEMTLNDIEACITVNPSVDTMYKLSKALGCCIEDLL